MATELQEEYLEISSVEIGKSVAATLTAPFIPTYC